MKGKWWEKIKKEKNDYNGKWQTWRFFKSENSQSGWKMAGTKLAGLNWVAVVYVGYFRTVSYPDTSKLKEWIALDKLEFDFILQTFYCTRDGYKWVQRNWNKKQESWPFEAKIKPFWFLNNNKFIVCRRKQKRPNCLALG